MLIQTQPDQTNAIFRAMRRIATAKGTVPLTDTDRATMQAAYKYVFRSVERLDLEHLGEITPDELADALPQKEVADSALRFLAVIALVDGAADEKKIAAVMEFATALNIHEDYLKELSEAAQHHIQWVIADMNRHNIQSVFGMNWTHDVTSLLLPYQGTHTDPELVARYEALGHLPDEIISAELFGISTKGTITRFPAMTHALNEAFSTPHDAAHVLSGYDTTPHGEILVSTFTAGMHPNKPMAGHILPAIFSWHLGIEFNPVAKSMTGQLDPEQFWEAWVRGSELTVDTFAPGWKIWSIAEESVEKVRRQYNVPPPTSHT